MTSAANDAAVAPGICEGCFLGLGLGIVEGDDGQKICFVCRQMLKNELVYLHDKPLTLRKLVML